MTMPGEKAHPIGESQDEAPFYWGWDWPFWDVSYDSESPGKRCHNMVLLQCCWERAHWDVWFESESTGNAYQVTDWTESNAGGRLKRKHNHPQIKQMPNQITDPITETLRLHCYWCTMAMDNHRHDLGQCSNEFWNERDSHTGLIMSYCQFNHLPGVSPPRYVMRNLPISWLARLQRWQRIEWSQQWTALRWSEPDGHWSGLRQRITMLMLSTDDSWLHNAFHRVCGCTVQRPNRVQAHLNLVSKTIFSKAYFLPGNKCDETTSLKYTIDSFDCCWQQRLPAMQSNERIFEDSNNSDQDLYLDEMSYGYSTGWLVRCCMTSDMDISRDCGRWCSSTATGSIE